MRGNLLASAPSLALIHESVTDFYCGAVTYLHKVGDSEWLILSDSTSQALPGVRIVKRGRRYRFEMTPLA